MEIKNTIRLNGVFRVAGFLSKEDNGKMFISKKHKLHIVVSTVLCYNFSYFLLFTYVFSLFLEVSQLFDS